ncbi:hypothetical protein OG742_37310 [Streptomyces sp. NBC_00828]|uniref:hypothetical protein n=1 Tax=Streptomyces sp. NBC_00828 TaxID=2903678 RepID=UPI00386B2B25
MTIHRHYQYGATTGAITLTALAAICLYRDLYAPAAGLALGAAVLTEAAVRERRRHRRVLAEHEWARRRALGLNPAPLRPCCLLGQASGGTVHRQCTRVSVAALIHLAEDNTPTTKDSA